MSLTRLNKLDFRDKNKCRLFLKDGIYFKMGLLVDTFRTFDMKKLAEELT